MLRALLGDRFRLRTHEETRQLAVYDLVVERGGSKVPVTKDVTAMPTVHVAAGALELTNATSATFASQLSYAVARPVLDRTRLSGTFDFRLQWTPVPGEDGGPTTAGLPAVVAGSSDATTNGPSLFTALREQLGLQLEPDRGPVVVIVIDHVELPRPD
jgi:uncharacterized protein (TIGR03435 family)